MYLRSDQVSISLKRLASRNQEGKSHLERTSALMYFLAFDSSCKIKDCIHIDFDPEKKDGKSNRKLIELEYTKLILLSRVHGKIIQVIELGKIEHEGKDPEKRISSNFLTVPLKKASDHVEPFYYPRRPATPLMGLGQSATGIKWGISHFEDWQVNLPKLLSDVKQSTPFTDLAIFIFRDTYFGGERKDYILALSKKIKERFTHNLSSFWIERIEKEKVLVRHITEPFTELHDPFAKTEKLDTNAASLSVFSNEKLVKHIEYLEALLADYKIKFKSLI